MDSFYTFAYRVLISANLWMFVIVGGVGQSTQRRNPRDVTREANRQELDQLLLRKPILTTEDNSARQAALKQINEDFKAIQVLNNNLSAALNYKSEVLDYKAIANDLSQLGSKALRLQESLFLPKVELEKNDKLFNAVEGAQQFREALTEFDKLVESFSKNPIFQQKNVMDIELASKASRDLELIIKQSKRLKKIALRLGRERTRPRVPAA